MIPLSIQSLILGSITKTISRTITELWWAYHCAQAGTCWFGNNTLQRCVYIREKIGNTITFTHVTECVCLCVLISVYSVAPQPVKLERQ